MRMMVILVCALIVVVCHGLSSQPNLDTSLWYYPSQVHLTQVFQSYPDTLWRRLVSSVPRRPFALANVTLHIKQADGTNNNNDHHSHNMIVIQGASSSGKSTILRLVAGQEQPVQGSVAISVANNYYPQHRCYDGVETDVVNSPLTASAAAFDTTPAAAKPIYLGRKEFPRCGNVDEQSTTMKAILDHVIDQELRSKPVQRRTQITASGFQSTPNTQSCPHQKIMISREEANVLATQLCELCDLTQSTTATGQQQPAPTTLNQLSPSEFYRWGLVIASLQSILQSASVADTAASTDTESSTRRTTLKVPAPILLLDEWMDLETSGIVRTVELSLMRLARRLGAVILLVTHKPHLLGHVHPTITMCRGEILFYSSTSSSSSLSNSMEIE